MIKTKKNKRNYISKEEKRLSKEFDFITGMLKGSLVEGERKND